MPRFINIAGAQLGPIARNETRQQVVSRLLELMRDAKARGSDIVVYPELALTTFFPRWWMEDDAEIDSFFEREMPSPATRPLFEAAKDLEIGFILATPSCSSTMERCIITTRRSWSTTKGLSLANIARCICRVMPITGPAILSNIWRNGTSNPAIWVFPFGAPSTAMSECVFAMIGAGPKPIASWGCKGSS